MFAIIQAAGWPIWFLLFASVVAVALIIERSISLRASRIIPPTLLDQVVSVYRRQGLSPEVIERLSRDSPLGAVLAAGLRNLKSSRYVMKEAIEEAGRGVAHDLERFLTTLGTIATAAPLLGLFGTVIGMIEIFGSQSPTGANPQQLAHGISIALYNTAFGIGIAIPALIFYRHFSNKVDTFVVEMEQQAVKLVDIVHGERSRVNFQRGKEKEPLEINLMPLIDVMMVILIFLMVTTTYSQVHRAADQPAHGAGRAAARAAQRDHGAGERAGAVRDQPQRGAVPQRRAARRRDAPRRRRPEGAGGGDQRRRRRHAPVGDPRDGSRAPRRPVADHLHDPVRKIIKSGTDHVFRAAEKRGLSLNGRS